MLKCRVENPSDINILETLFPKGETRQRKKADDELGAAQEPAVLLQVSSATPIGGKLAFTVPYRKDDPVRVVRESIAAQVGVASLPDLQIFAVGRDLPLRENLSLSQQGYEIPPILAIRGVTHEVTLRTYGVDKCAVLPWKVHATVADVVREVFRRYRPLSLQWMRLSVHVAQPDGTMQRVALPIQNTFVYPKGAHLDPATRMNELNLTAGDADPCTVQFLRTRDGRKYVLEFALRGSSSVGEVADRVLQLEASHREVDFFTKETLLSIEEDRVQVDEQPPYDDSDEEVAPGGVRQVYFHGLKPHALFSFNPPQECCEYVTPQFISIEEDFTICHLTDLGVHPGCSIYVEYYNPHTDEWSGDVATRLDVELKQCKSVQDLLTVRTQRGSLVRVPVGPLTTMESILARVWCATGDLPMFSVLQSDEGRILQPWDTVVDAQLFPQATVHAVRRPRPWLGEPPTLPPPPRFAADFGVYEPDVIAS